VDKVDKGDQEDREVVEDQEDKEDKEDQEDKEDKEDKEDLGDQEVKAYNALFHLLIMLVWNHLMLLPAALHLLLGKTRFYILFILRAKIKYV
jgi:hypothetical protein